MKSLRTLSAATAILLVVVALYYGLQEQLSRRLLARSGGTLLSESEITNATRQAIVTLHNDYRDGMWASDMRKMSYDYELEATAKEYSKTCSNVHSEASQRQHASWTHVGENLYYGGSSYDELYQTAMNLFIAEEDDYNIIDNSCTAICGHLTQIIWAETYKVGCGSSECLDNADSTIKQFLVCHYGPSGNYEGVKPYTRSGSRCSACATDDDVCDEDDLCSNPARDLWTGTPPSDEDTTTPETIIATTGDDVSLATGSDVTTMSLGNGTPCSRCSINHIVFVL